MHTMICPMDHISIIRPLLTSHPSPHPISLVFSLPLRIPQSSGSCRLPLPVWNLSEMTEWSKDIWRYDSPQFGLSVITDKQERLYLCFGISFEHCFTAVYIMSKPIRTGKVTSHEIHVDTLYTFV